MLFCPFRLVYDACQKEEFHSGFIIADLFSLIEQRGPELGVRTLDFHIEIGEKPSCFKGDFRPYAVKVDIIQIIVIGCDEVFPRGSIRSSLKMQRDAFWEGTD